MLSGGRSRKGGGIGRMGSEGPDICHMKHIGYAAGPESAARNVRPDASVAD